MKVQEALKAAIEALNSCSKNTFWNGGYEQSFNQYSVEIALSLCKSALSDIEKCEPAAIKVTRSTDGRLLLTQPDGKYFDVNEAIGKTFYTSPISKECEPVAWQFYQDGKWHNGMETNNHKKNTIDAGIPVRILYTSPQPRDWVGLSDTAWMNIVNHDHAYESMNKEDAVHYAVKATEAKLKQLNTKG